MDSNQLMHFKAIAECENITKAAEKLFISQPALSKSLSNLEAELGSTLFNRVGRRLYLNSNGKKLLHYVYQMNEIFEKISENFRQKTSRILSICGVGCFFPFLLKDYFKDGMRPIKINAVPDESILEMLLSGAADVAVADNLYLTDDYKTGLRHIPILNEQLLLSVPLNHHFASQRTVKITDLENEDIIHSTSPNEINNWLDKILGLNKIQMNWSMDLDSETWKYYMMNVNGDMPPYFESSSTFLTSRDHQNAQNKRVLLKVEGVYTSRMIFIWYFERDKEFLSEFLQCAKNAYL